MLREVLGNLNESSSMSKIGVNPKQIKGIYSILNRGWGGTVIKDDAEFVSYKAKKEVTNIMRSRGNGRVAVVGLSKGGRVFVSIEDTQESIYHVYEFDSEGKKTNSWTEKSAIKAISHFIGVKEYQVSTKGTTHAKSSDQFYDDSKENMDTFAYGISKLIENEVLKEFEKARKQLGEKISKLALSGDFVGAYELIARLTKDKSRQFDHGVVERTFSDFIGNSSSWERSSIKSAIIDSLAEMKDKTFNNFGIIPARARFLQSQDKEDIRKASAGVLKMFKERINRMVGE